MTKKKKKHPKMDRLLISSEPHELKTAARKKKVSKKKIVEAKKSVGVSRKRVYAKIDKDKLK
jgi:hypothetical protein